jgi:3-deoxy-manno-octulosonate cytidylyltransferase (CMP-KDO synthetase)
MLERVWRAARASDLDRVLIATDDVRIADEARRIGADVTMTAADLPSGSDRCAAAVRSAGLRPSIVVNIQGDEPLLQPQLLNGLVRALEQSGADVATPISRILFSAELDDAAVVKVVRGANNHALYFSRAAVPAIRDVNRSDWTQHHTYWKHIGLYAYTWPSLQRHVQLPPSALEQCEKLEQLRLLEDGARFVCVETEQMLMSVDTPDDAERVRLWLRAHGTEAPFPA